MDFPGDFEQWKVTGNEPSFTLCGSGVCINSIVGKNARITLDIPVEQDKWLGVDQLVFEVEVASITNARLAQSESSLSFIVARARSAAGKNLRNLGSVITLENHSQERLHRRISSLHPQTANLQLVVVLRHALALKMVSVRFYSIKLSTYYRLLRAALFLGWVVLLLLLTLRVLSQLTRCAQVISATGFTLLLVVGASQYGSRLTKQLSNVLGADWSTHLTGMLTLSNNTSLALLHIVFHLILTVCMGRFSQPAALTHKQIFAINLSIALGIECVQMAIPERTADIEDLASAMLGMLIGLSLLRAFTQIRTPKRTDSQA